MSKVRGCRLLLLERHGLVDVVHKPDPILAVFVFKHGSVFKNALSLPLDIQVAASSVGSNDARLRILLEPCERLRLAFQRH